MSRMTFERELSALINKHSMENKSDTPDFILTDYLMGCLDNYELATKRRQDWHRPEKAEAGQ